MRGLAPTLLFLAGSFTASPAVAQVGAAAPEGQPPQIDCMPGPYIVFFSPGSARLRPAAVEILDDVIEASRAPCGNGSLVVAGHADRSGRPSRNRALSGRRAAAVAHYLEARGISRGQVTRQAFGESRPLDGTKNRLHEPENRRVEVVFAPDLHE
jgi:OOP family OmpA-OmpF porin